MLIIYALTGNLNNLFKGLKNQFKKIEYINFTFLYFFVVIKASRYNPLLIKTNYFHLKLLSVLLVKYLRRRKSTQND